MKAAKSLLFLITMTLISSQSFSMQKLINLFKKPEDSMSRGLREARLKQEAQKVANKFKWPKTIKFHTCLYEKDDDDSCVEMNYDYEPNYTIKVGKNIVDGDIKILQFSLAHELAHCQQDLEGIVYFDPKDITYLSQKLEFDADKRAAIALEDASGGLEEFRKLLKKEESYYGFWRKILKNLTQDYYTQQLTQHPKLSDRIKQLQEVQKQLNQGEQNVKN